MKLRKLLVDGFRGAPKALEVKLKPEKSHFFFSENGRGKSTIADAVEFLTSGGLGRFNREECGLDAAINLRAQGEASVSAVLSEPDGNAKRTLDADGASELQSDLGGLEPIPALRQATIAEFMEQTAGEKRQALLELLDLDALNDFRATLRKAVGKTKDRRKSAQTSHREESETLGALLDGEQVLSAAAALAKSAGIEKRIDTVEALDALVLSLPPGEPNRQPALTELLRALEAVPEDEPSADWSAAIEDSALREGEALGTLLEQGAKVLGDAWDRQSCPLCEVEQDHDELTHRVQARAKALADSNRRLADLRVRLTARNQAAASLAQAISALLKLAPAGGWPDEEALSAEAEALSAYAEAVKRASEQLTPAPAPPTAGIDIAARLPGMREAAAPKRSPELDVLQRLVELRSVNAQVGRRLDALERAKEHEAALKRALEIADATIKEAVEDSLSGIEELVARYFEILMADPIYTDVRLVYAARRAGQVEFSIKFGEATVKPPQRIMSESQLNALGLALLLARVKSSETPWRTLILDDVVNSFDSPHRAGLIRLLRQEFSEWQVIVFSHDSVFRDIALREATDWGFQEIVIWTADGGPVLGDGDPLSRLEQELAAGASASGLGGYARRALETKLSKAASELGCRIPYDPAARYTAHDLLGALIHELKEKNSSLAELEVLRRMDTANYMATRAVHARADLAEPTTDDLKRLAADLSELDQALRCTECGKRVWFAESQEGHQCKCGALRV
jgi:recombinational DNA repair ATPase RecF